MRIVIVYLYLMCVAPTPPQRKCGEDETLRVLLALTTPAPPHLELSSGLSQCVVNGTQEVLDGCLRLPVTPRWATAAFPTYLQP